MATIKHKILYDAFQNVSIYNLHYSFLCQKVQSIRVECEKVLIPTTDVKPSIRNKVEQLLLFYF